MDEIKNSKWAFFRGIICTCNEDGSIPLNSKVVLEVELAGVIGNDREEQAHRVVDIHNAMLAAAHRETARA